MMLGRIMLRPVMKARLPMTMTDLVTLTETPVTILAR